MKLQHVLSVQGFFTLCVSLQARCPKEIQWFINFDASQRFPNYHSIYSGNFYIHINNSRLWHFINFISMEITSLQFSTFFLHYRHIEYKKDITCFSKDCFDMCIKSSNKAIQWLCVSICVYAFFWGWWDIMQNLMTSEWKTWK